MMHVDSWDSAICAKHPIYIIGRGSKCRLPAYPWKRQTQKVGNAHLVGWEAQTHQHGSKLWSSWKFKVCIAHTKINLESATGTTHSLHLFREMYQTSWVLSFGPDLLHGMPFGTGAQRASLRLIMAIKKLGFSISKHAP